MLPDRGPAAHILVVDDNPADVELLRLALDTTDLVYTLTAVADGADALALFRKEAADQHQALPDLVILDLNLPKYDGLEILDAVRSNRKFSELPVIVLSSSTSPRELSKVQAYGHVRYVPKPPDLDQYLMIGGLIKDFLAESRRRQP